MWQRPSCPNDNEVYWGEKINYHQTRKKKTQLITFRCILPSYNPSASRLAQRIKGNANNAQPHFQFNLVKNYHWGIVCVKFSPASSHVDLALAMTTVIVLCLLLLAMGSHLCWSRLHSMLLLRRKTPGWALWRHLWWWCWI
jgi:hypothetical protein